MSIMKQMAVSLRKLYRDKATITVEKHNYVNKTGLDNDTQTVTICTNEPCKISRTSSKIMQPPAEGDNLVVIYDVMLFIRTGIDIPAGAIVEITDANGGVTRYRRASGNFSSYESHQEIGLVYDERK